MKFALLFLFFLIFSLNCKSQDDLALTKDEYKTVSVYDSTFEKIIYRVNPGTYFYCSELKGDWYVFNIPYLFNGRIHKDSIEFFQDLPLTNEIIYINKAFDNFSRICLNDADSLMDTLYLSDRLYPDSIFINRTQLYYDNTYYPMLNKFSEYYSISKNQNSLVKLLSTYRCGPDGDFAETFYPTLGYCYDIDKTKFITTLNSIKNKKKKIQYRTALFSGIGEYYKIKYDREKISQDKVDNKIHLEKQRVLKLTSKSLNN